MCRGPVSLVLSKRPRLSPAFMPPKVPPPLHRPPPGALPYPCRHVITSKPSSNGPQYSLQIRDWKTGDEVAADDFAFDNPTNAEKIDLKDLQEMMSDLPQHFVKGDAQ